MSIARLLISYKYESGIAKGTTIALELPEYASMTANQVLSAINTAIANSTGMNTPTIITNVIELTARSSIGYSQRRRPSCYGCGDPDGHFGLACPKLTLTATEFPGV